jgi:hypothetical protein
MSAVRREIQAVMDRTQWEIGVVTERLAELETEHLGELQTEGKQEDLSENDSGLTKRMHNLDN